MSDLLWSGATASVIILALQLPPMGSGAPPEWFALALREGGAYLVIVLLLHFYRRDLKTAGEYWKDQNAITTQLAKESTKANTEMAAALAQNTVVVHAAKNVMQQYLPKRRDEDG